MSKVAKVAIVGGGPTGMALALALKQQGIGSSIFEARSRAAVKCDARILALSHGARQILEWLGVWQDIPATPIDTIHVSHRGGLGRTKMQAADLNAPALGYVLAASDLIIALDVKLAKAGIDYREETKVGAASSGRFRPDGLPAGDTALDGFDLIAWAEGAVDPDAAQTRDYGQHAVLCTASVAEPHRGVAWERFTDDGPVALLPFGKDYAVVLTIDSVDADRILGLDDAGFTALLQRRFGTRHRFTAVSPRVAYPLGLRWRENPTGGRQVWLGNAAQTLHPVAGQGFNLALRDLWELARHLGGAEDIGDADVLSAYARGRQTDRRGAIGFTNLLIDSFASDFGPLKHARGAGLLALDLFPPLRNFVARRMIFGARVWP
jgi:2-octaprenyl-6-methoxyphenol hydroxylase